ncbi:MAG: hypothetical protein WD270_05430 [Acetobacterales bacterium]
MKNNFLSRAIAVALVAFVVGAAPLPAAAQSQALNIAPTERPDGLVPSVTDPMSHTIYTLAWNMGVSPESLLGKPARTAKMLAMQEWLTQRLLTGETMDFDGLDLLQMERSREVFRLMLGIAADAPAERVIPYLWELSQAYASGNDARVSAILTSDLFAKSESELRAQLQAFSVPVDRSRAIQRVEDSFKDSNVNDDGGCRDSAC